MPRHPSFLLKIKILDIFYISLSLFPSFSISLSLSPLFLYLSPSPLSLSFFLYLSFSIFLSLSFFLYLSFSIFLSLSPCLSLSLIGEEGVHTLASIKHALTDPVHRSERERERERERGREREREEEEGGRERAHPCKHKARLHSKHSSFSQPVSMSDYYINCLFKVA